MMSEEIQDPLKPLSEVTKPDPRHAQMVLELPEIHATLSEIVLSEHVPNNVRQLFETAKNVALYSWFVYRFHQVAELVAYSALELALKERAGITEWAEPRKGQPRGLGRLLELAGNNGWLRTDDFLFVREMAVERARDVQVRLALQGAMSGDDIPVPEPTADEISAAMREIDYVQILIRTVPYLRNTLAHGSSTLSPRSIPTLKRVAETINLLFVDRQ
jgi:hypothetical protein